MRDTQANAEQGVIITILHRGGAEGKRVTPFKIKKINGIFHILATWLMDGDGFILLSVIVCILICLSRLAEPVMMKMT